MYGSIQSDREDQIKKLLQSWDLTLSVNNPDILTVDIPEDKKSVGIGEVKPSITWLSQKPFSHKVKGVIINSAERLTTEAQNSLLKTLEEPPEYAFIILNTKGLDYLLPTVVSRCQKLLVTGDSATPVVTGDEKSNTYISIIKMSLGERLDLAGELAKEEKEDLIEMAEGWANELSKLTTVRKSDVSNVKNILAFKKDLENTNINVRIAIESLFLNFN